MTTSNGARMPASLLLSPQLLSLRPRVLWAAMTRQPLTVWSVAVYLFLEYVRPQSIYPAIDVIPWARIALITATISMLAQAMSVRRWTILDSGMVLFSMVVLASSVMAVYPDASFEGLDVYLSWILVYAFLSTNINTQSRVLLMLAGWFLWNLKMTLHAFRSWAAIGFSFRTWGVTGAPGWFQNSGEFGIQTTVIFPIALYFALGIRPFVSRRTFFALLVLPFTALTGAVASSSRGALLGLAAIGIWMLLRSKYKLRGTIWLVVAGVFVWAVLPPEQKARFSATGDDHTSVTRLTYWERGVILANEHPMLGVGYKNWMPVYRERFQSLFLESEKVELPHNIFIEAWSELGYLGLGALLFLVFGTFRLNAKTRALARTLGFQGRLSEHLGWGFDGALIGFIVSGSFVTVLYYPYLWVNLGMSVALHLSVSRTVRAARSVRQQSHAGFASVKDASLSATAQFVHPGSSPWR